MATQPVESLSGKKILVVEDEYWIAADVGRALNRADATVIGPVSCIQQALDLIQEHVLDAAVLDVNLDGVMSYPLAKELDQRGVPFLFATGYDEWALPLSWQRPGHVTKPFSGASIVASLSRILSPNRVPHDQFPPTGS